MPGDFVYQRPCTECDNLLPRGSSRVTCSDNCRAKRSRRLKRERKASAQQSAATRAANEGEAIPEVRKIVNEEIQEIAHQVAQQELRPVVRSAITEEVMSSVGKMMGLAPVAVAALAMDMTSSDSAVRQKAYALWFKYTVGNAAVNDDSGGPPSMVVKFAMPRPDSASAAEFIDEPIADAEEYKVCDMCGNEKPTNLFVANSDRCGDCVAKLRDKAQQLLDGDTSGD